MATPPLWNEIESDPTFQGLAPEQKSKVLMGWTQQVVGLSKSPEEKLALEAIADAKNKAFAGAPMPENMGEYVKTYAQQRTQQEVDAKAKEKADRPFFGFEDTLNSLKTVAVNLPLNVKAAAYQLKEGLEAPSDRSPEYQEVMAEKRAADEAVQAEQARREAEGLATSVGSAGREFSASSGFSGVAMGSAMAGGMAGKAVGAGAGALIGGAAGAPAGGVGAVPGAAAGSGIGAAVGSAAGILGGLAASGAAAYRMAGASFLDDAFDLANKQSVEEKGRPLSKEEEKALHKQLLPIAQNSALWEAGPEAVGNVFTLGVGKALFKGIGKEVATKWAKTALGKAGLVAADVGVELAGETATQVGGQGWDQAKMEAVLAGKDPDTVANPYAGAAGIAKGFEEIAPATLFGSALMGGGAGLVGVARDQYIKAQEAKAQAIADTAAALANANAPQALNALVQTAEEAAAVAGLELPENLQARLAARTAGLTVPAPVVLNPAFADIDDEELNRRIEEADRFSAEEGRADRASWAYDAALMRQEVAARLGLQTVPTRQTPEEAAAAAGLTAPEGTRERLAAQAAGLTVPTRQTPEEAPATAGIELPEELQARVAARTAGLVAPVRPTLTPTETPANAPTQEYQVESPSGTAPVQGQPPVETPAGQIEEGTPPRQDQGEVVEALPLDETPPTPNVEVQSDLPSSVPAPTTQDATPASGREPTPSGEVAIVADIKPRPAGTSQEQRVMIGETQVGTIKHEPSRSNPKIKVYHLYNQAGEIVKEFGNLRPAKEEAKKVAKDLVTPVAVEVKPKRYRSPFRFPDNPNTGAPDILNFVSQSSMVVPSARFKAKEAKAGKSVGGERDPLRDIEGLLTKAEREALWDVTDKPSFADNTIDVVAQLAFEENLISAPSPDVLIEAILQASKERKAGSLQAREQKVLTAREEQTKAFDEAVTTKTGTNKRIVSSEVVVGNRYTILDKEFTVTEVIYDEEDGTPLGAVLTSPTFGEQRVDLGQPFYVTEDLGRKTEVKPAATSAQPTEVKPASLESLLEGTESTRPKNKGETAKPQAADVLAELGAATRAGKAEQEQEKMELPPATTEAKLEEPQTASFQALKADIGEAVANWTPEELAAFDSFVTTGNEEAIAQLSKIKRGVANRVAATLGVKIAAPKVSGVVGVAKPARKKLAAEKLAALDTEAEKLLRELRALSGKVSMGVDPAYFAVVAKLGKVVVTKGAINFKEFASDIKDMAPDLWEQLKQYLSSVWAYLANEDRSLPEVTRSEVDQVLAELDAAPVTAEVTPVTEEEVTPEKAVSGLTLTERISFGKQRGKTLGALLREGKTEYLFQTLFSPTVLAGADATKTAEVQKLRDLISQTEEYQSYQKEQSMTAAELAAAREPLQQAVEDAVQNLETLGFKAKVLPDGSVAIAAEAAAVASKDALVSSGFSYDNQKGWVSKTYERVVRFSDLVRSKEAGKPVGTQAVVAAQMDRIRETQRDKLAEQEDQSAPPAGQKARPFMTNAVVRFFEAAMAKALGQERVEGGRVAIPSRALSEQQWDSMLISKAQAEGKPMYLLASSAGTGKTFVMGAALASIRSRNPEGKIIFVTRSQELIKQAKKNFSNFPEVGEVTFMTYANLDDAKAYPPSASDVLIFDEAHEVRYGLSDTSARSKKAAEWMGKSKFTLLTTATPYESIEQMEYLKATGVFDSLQDVKGLFDDGWFNFAAITGAKVLQRDGKPSSIDFSKMSEADKMAGQLYAREFLRKNGMFSQRNAIIPDGMSEANFTEVTGTKEWADLAEAIQEAFKKVKKPSSNDKGFYTNILKRVLEASKADAAIALARKEAEEGRQVVIFVETKSESNRDLVDIVEKWDEAQAEYAAAKAVDPNAKFVVPEGVPNLPGVIEMFRNMIEAGTNEIKFESAQEKFARAFGDQVAFYTGDEAGAAGQDSISRWENPDAPNPASILVATMARGGTGLSLHDTSEGGKYPRTQITLNLPWRASEVEQVAGRTVRYGMTSVARGFWLFAGNLLNEGSLATRVGERLKSMNMLVRGAVTLAADKIDSKDWTINPFTNEVAEQARALPTPIEGGMAEALAEDIRQSLSEQVPSGKVVGGITEQNAKNGLDLIAKLIPMARRMVRLGTAAELLADPELTEAERASIRRGAQGYYSKGKVVVVTDQVKQTIFHKNADIAAAATILHELMHHGTDIIRGSNKQLHADWLSLISQYVTDAQIERLVKVQGYFGYADWNTDMAVKEKAMEEIFVRQIEGLFVRKGSLSFAEKNKLQQFLGWLKRFVTSALGLPESELIPDKHLEDLGQRFIKAINSAQFVAQTQEVSESTPDLGSLPPENQRSLLSPYNDEEKASLEAYKKANPELGLKFSQVLGLENGSIADIQSVQASTDAAYTFLQLGQDPDTGRPIVNKEDEARLLAVAAQLTAQGSTFGVKYQVGRPDAATGVLQMVLTQAGLEMAGRGDKRLIEMMRQNWNGIVMGAFLTHSSAGRLLQARGAYKNAVLDALAEHEAGAKAAAIKYLQEQGVENPEEYVRSVEELLQKAELDAQAIEKLKKLAAGIKLGQQDNLTERITEALKYTGGEIKRQFTAYTKEVLRVADIKKRIQDMRDKKAASSASQNFSDDLGVGEPLEDFGSIEEAEKALAASLKNLAKLGKELDKALGNKDGRGTGGKKDDQGTGTTGTAPTPTPVDEEAVEEVEEEDEDVNEATKAAKTILASLENFLKREFPSEPKALSIYAIIKRVVDANIANTSEKDEQGFAASLEKELSVHAIDEAVLKELVSTAWEVFKNYPEQRAKELTSRLQTKLPPNKRLKPEKVNQLNKLFTKYLKNKDKLEEADFLENMVKEMIPLDVSEETAAELAEETYKEHLERKERAYQARLKRTKKSLLAGSRRTLIAQIKKATQGEMSDPDWQETALRNVLTKSGILADELDAAVDTFTADERATIFETTVEKMEKTAAENLDKSVQRLIKRYEKYLKTPTNLPKPVPSPSLQKLVRNQVRVPTERALFVANAAAFGATREQADRLFDLATMERDMRKGEETSQTKMDVLIKYLLAQPTALLNDPKLRKTAIYTWLVDNGYTSQTAMEAVDSIDASFDIFVKEAQMKAIEKQKVQISSRAKAEAKNKGTPAEISAAKAKIAGIQKQIDAASTDIKVLKPLVDALRKAEDALAGLLPRNVAEQQVAKLQKLIRMGLGQDSVDPTRAFANANGYANLERSDYKAFNELDLKITKAKNEQRIHDYAIGIKELFDLLARRKGDMTALERLAISYNNSALSGLGTLAINIIAPMGALMTRVGIDIGVAFATGDIEKVNQIFQVLRDSATIIKNEVKFSIVGGANTNDWSRVIMNATSLQQPLAKALAVVKDPKANPLSRMKNAAIAVQGYTDITRRILMATDHVWFSVLENYFLKTQALSMMKAAGVKDTSQVKALLFSITSGYSSRLSDELAVLHRYENAIENLRGTANPKRVILALLKTPLAATMSPEARSFEEDLRGDIRRAIRAKGMPEAKTIRLALGAVRLQRTLSNIRVRDNMARDIVLAMKEILPDADLSGFKSRESSYEMGVHKGEEGPAYDVINTVVNAIHGAGNTVIRKHPILGRMLLGYFGIPANLLNRAMWFTPYGLIRYAIAARARNNLKIPPNQFYQQSMQTNEQIRQRLIEAVVGTTAVAALMSLKALMDDDDDDAAFNVTLIGPTNKTEQDAWKKAGHRPGSMEFRVGDKIVALNVMRGPMEPLKVALLMVGAMDDMRLNRKENDGEFAQYFSEYLTAMLTGWGKQASFFGAKSTIGATLSVNPDASVLSTALYKLNPIIPFSGLISSAEKLMTGGDRFRGREGAIYLNLPIARSLLTQKAVNALGDPQGLNPSSAWAEGNERAWFAGFPLMVSGTPTGNDKKVYSFILDRGIAPGLPQRTALENKNGVMSDTEWQDYVAVRGGYLKRAMIRDLARLEKMDDDSAAKALGDMSTDATAYAKKQLRYK